MNEMRFKCCLWCGVGCQLEGTVDVTFHSSWVLCVYCPHVETSACLMADTAFNASFPTPSYLGERGER